MLKVFSQALKRVGSVGCSPGSLSSGGSPTFFQPAKVFKILNTEYARENRMVLMRALRDKFRPGEHDPLTLLAERDKIYARLEAGKAGRAQCDMIDDFVETFTPCGLFNRVIKKFLKEHPEAEEQKYKHLIKIFKQHFKTHSIAATTGSEGYAGLSERVPQSTVALTTSASDMEERIMANITAMMEPQQYALLSTLSQTQPPNTWNKQRDSKQPQRPTNQMAKQYCHTHGLVFHNSADCKKPGPRHDPTATFDNRKGGSNHNC
jgi:hypothetical protein